MLVKQIIEELKATRLSTEDRSELVAAILTSINALPIKDIIKVTAQGILISGKRLDADQALAFKQGIDVLVGSNIRRLILDQIKYEAVKLGVSQGMTPDQIMFSKVAIWCIEQEDILLASLTSEA